MLSEPRKRIALRIAAELQLSKISGSLYRSLTHTNSTFD